MLDTTCQDGGVHHVMALTEIILLWLRLVGSWRQKLLSARVRPWKIGKVHAGYSQDQCVHIQQISRGSAKTPGTLPSLPRKLEAAVHYTLS
jgi:hypothetical protein